MGLIEKLEESVIIILMLDIKPPAYKYCPFCGRKLKIRVEEEKKRKFCNNCSWTFYPHVAGAVAAVIISQGRVLMVQRKRKPYKETWMFPAGFIDYGEHPKDALVREVREETGLVLERARLIEVVQTKDDPRSPGHFCFFFEVKAKGNKIKTDKEENNDIDWFQVEKMPKIGWLSHKKIAKKIKVGGIKKF